MSEPPAPPAGIGAVTLATGAGPVLVEADPQPPERTGRIPHGLVPVRRSSGCLVLNPSPRSRCREGLLGLLFGFLALMLGLGLIALGLWLWRFREDNPVLENRHWGIWV